MGLPLDQTVLQYEVLAPVAVTAAGETLTLEERHVHNLVRIRMLNTGPNACDFAPAVAGTALTVGQNDSLTVGEPVTERVRARTWGFRCAGGQTASVSVAVEYAVTGT